MQVSVLDVGHGGGAYAVARNGGLVVVDCGHKSEPLFRPSSHLKQAGFHCVHRLFITNYDEDHISDLPRLRGSLRIRVLHRNKSVSPEELRVLKRSLGPLTPAMEELLDMMNTYTGGVTSPPELPGIDYTTFSNQFGEEFEDTNNVSLVTFLDCNGVTFLFPGDLEVEGWRRLLRQRPFCEALGTVDVMLASHHGRESGYCPEAFDHCSPDVIVVSDGPKTYASQEMLDTYRPHATGVTFNGESRRVLTTRRDGTITWNL